MDRLARRSRLERPLAYALAVVAAVALVAGGIALVSYLRSPKTLAEKIDRWIDEDDPSCLMERHDVTAAERPDLYPDLLSRARSATVVHCQHLGQSTVILDFGSRERRERAFGASSSAGESSWCVTGAQAFDGRSLDPGELQRFCARLGGAIRRRATPPAGP